MRFAQVRLITAGDMVGSLTSNGEDLQQIFTFSIQAVFTGAPVGSLKLQISNDIVNQAPSGSDPAANVVNWVDYSGSAQAITAAGNFMWTVATANFRWVRLVYTVTSGTGALSVIYTGKGV